MAIKNIQVVRIMMVKDKTIPYYSRKVCTPKDVAEIGFEVLKGADREYFVVICLSRGGTVNAVNIVSQGSAGHADVHPREVFKPAILANACSICLLHNHTSGFVDPSHEDIVITKRLIEASELLKIAVWDHVIISDGNFYSLRDHYGYIFKEIDINFIY